MEKAKQSERAVAYVRVSTTRQVSDGNSLTVQKHQVADLCNRRHYDLFRSWVEEAESAKTEDRPVLQEMLRYLAKNSDGIDVLVVPKLDRLARNSIDYAGIKKILRTANIRVESCTEVIEDTPVGRLTETLLASIAQFDNEVRAERSKGGMIQAVREGRWVWQPPLGYKPARSKLAGKKRGLGNIQPDPQVAPHIAECFRKIASGRLSTLQAHVWLKTQGIDLSASSMHRILRNPIYTGTIRAFGGEYDAKPPFIPLVTKERFALVQELLSRSKKLPEKYEVVNSEYPLRGSLRCPSCLRYMSSCWSKGRSKRFPYYRCRSCSKVNIPRKAITDAFVRELGTFKPHNSFWHSFKKRIEAYEEFSRRDALENSQAIRKEISKIEQVRSSMAMKSAEGIIPDDIARQELHSLTARIGELQEQLEKIELSDRNLEEIFLFGKWFLRKLPIAWKRTDTLRQKKLQSFFFPEGITLEGGFSLRTGQYPILERIKAVLAGPKYHLVDPNSEMPNQAANSDQEVLDWLESLYAEFSDDWSEL